MKKMKEFLRASYFEALFLAANVTDSRPFWGIHEIIRKFYLYPFTDVLEKYLKERVQCPALTLVPRHSVVRNGEFRIFLSDLDLSAILPQACGKSEIMKLGAQHRFLKSLFPFLGEMEIYFKEEWDLKESLEARFRDFFLSLRDLRKLSWQKTVLRNAASRYHRYKAVRAITKILMTRGVPQGNEAGAGEDDYRRLSAGIQRATEDVLNIHCGKNWKDSCASSDSDSVWAPYLGCALSIRPTENTREIILDPALRVALLAMIPATARLDEVGPLTESIARIRKMEGFQRIRSSLLAWELAQFRGFVRSAQSTEAWVTERRAIMEEELKASVTLSSCLLGSSLEEALIKHKDL